MTPEQKIKTAIIMVAMRHGSVDVPKTPLTAENVDQIYEAIDGDDCNLQDARNEMRSGTVETKLPCDWSRHYEAKSVAAQMPDGTWVGWTYWYGGGKHAEPEAIDWMGAAYQLDCKEREEMVVVRTFTKVD
jgi:hypothetical protein